METIIIKIIYLLIIFLICFVGGIAPIKLSQLSDKALSYSNCLGAGILLGASLIHLLAESEEMIETEFPLSHLFFIMGFFGSFILERVIFEHKHDHTVPAYQPHNNTDKHGDIQIVDNESIELENIKENSDSPIILSNITVSTPNSTEGSDVSSPLVDSDHTYNDDDSHSGVVLNLHSNVVDGSKDTDDEDEDHDHGHNDKKKKSHGHKKHKKDKHGKSGKGFPFMLFSVLALESIISGSALGVQEDRISIFVTFLAIVTHIWAESFALTAAVLKSKPVLSTIYKSVFIFSLMTPVGGVFGLISEHLLSKSESNFISSVLMALASGCFLYVSIFEIMVEEFQDDSGHGHGHGHGHGSGDLEENKHDNGHHKHKCFSIPTKWKKTLLLMSGFTFMTVLAIYV